MIRAIMHGCNGRMGRMITELVGNDSDMEIVAGVDIVDNCANSYPVFTKLEDCNIDADVLIDFGNAAATEGLVNYCVGKKLPIVLCTTGLSDEQLKLVKDASDSIPILRSANMSLGVNVLLDILKKYSGILNEAGFDIEVVEKHHRTKLDSPSGTALALADAAQEGCKKELEYVYDRSGRRMARPDNEIGISAVRGGTIVGDHDVVFAGTDEVVTLSHRAYSRAVFAKGAISAAKYLAGRAAGMYSMADVIEEE